MRSNSYDTRFLIELFHASSKEKPKKIREILKGSKPNFVSTIALSELYDMTLRRAGKEVADMQMRILERDFRIVEVSKEVAVEAALIRVRQKMPLADSLIAATAILLDIPCYTYDPHFRRIKNLQVKWID